MFNNKIEAKSGGILLIKGLISQANSVVVALIKRGITKSDKICIFSPNTIPYSVLIFTSYFLGVTLVPFSPSIAAYELKKYIENLESVVIFTSVEKVKYFDEIIDDHNSGKRDNLKIKSVFVFDANFGNYIPFERLLEEGKDQILDRIPHFDVDPKSDIFLLLRSSGTTGLPKVTIITHYYFVSALTPYWTLKQLNDLRVLMVFPSGQIASSRFLYFWTSSGATVVLLEKFDEDLYLTI